MREYIALDIGGSKIKYGKISEKGEILFKDEIETPVSFSSEIAAQKFFGLIDSLIDEKVKGIGIATLGGVDEEKGEVIGICDNFKLIREISLKKVLEKKYNIPVYVMNDVNAAAIGEAWVGAGKGLSTFYCITLGTGIGGALVINNQVYRGVNGFAGEVGLLWKCSGSSYEDYASARTFSKQANEIMPQQEQALRAAFEGEAKYEGLLTEWIEHVARGLSDIIYVLDPGTIIIGGGVSSIGKQLTERIQKRLDEIMDEEFCGITKLIPSQYGNNSNLIGAIKPLIDAEGARI